jgi:hypothetical protein
MSFKLQSKEIYYVIETTMKDYAWINRLNSMTPPSNESSTYNSDKKRVFECDQAKAFHIISMSLGDDDKGARGEYELDIKGFWTSLKVKYQKTSQSTARMYMTKIQTFAFDEDKCIFIICAKHKEYRRKLIVADSNLKATYPDAALFLILCRSLPIFFKPLIYEFLAQPTLANEDKMDILVEYEMDMWMEETKRQEAHIAKSNAKVSMHRYQRSNSDSEEGTVIEYYLYNGDHAFWFCNHIKLARKLLKRYLRKQKYTEYSGKMTSSGLPGKKLTSKPHGYPETGSTSDNNLDISPNSSSPDNDDGILGFVTSLMMTSARLLGSLGQLILVPPRICQTNLLSSNKMIPTNR